MKTLAHGLNLTPVDHRDFSLSKAFGAPSIVPVPLHDWLEGVFNIKDQKNTDFCTGYGSAAVSEDQEEPAVLDPAFAFTIGKKEQGSWQGYGGDLRTVAQGHCDVGCIEVGQNPLDFGNKPRDFIANWNNWPLSTLIPLAAAHKKKSYFKVDGHYDTFDNIRAALWANNGAATPDGKPRSILTGCMWRPGWLYCEGGVIPNVAVSGGTGHCFKIANGQKTINGEPHLIIQNSAGTDAGDKGFHYMSRAVANRELVFGCYMFFHMSPAAAKALLQQQGALVTSRITNPLTALTDWARQMVAMYL